MHDTALDAERSTLADHLKRLSAPAWVAAVDEIADRPDVRIEEALGILAGRFSGDYLESRRAIIWPMLEYLHIRLEPGMWADPLRHNQDRQLKPKGRNAAA
jgi:hypothetical protein